MIEGMLFGSLNLREPGTLGKVAIAPFDNIAFLAVSSCFAVGPTPS